MMKTRNKNRGFTLVELIMVIAILSILSSLAISKYSSIQQKSAKKLSASNQLRITQAVETFLIANEGGLDKLDALIDYGTADVSAPANTFNGQFAGKYGESLNSPSSVGGIYRGPKGTSATDDIFRKNSGLSPDLAKVLCVYYPTADEIKALKLIGLERVTRAWTDPATSPDDSSVRGEDGSYVMLENGMDPSASSAIITSNVAGRALAAINIAFGHSATEIEKRSEYKRGVRIYQEMGADVTITDEINNYSEPSDAQSVGVLLAFGLGESSSIIGSSNGGIATVPTCEFLDKKYYRNYILLIRLNRPASGYGTATAEFAGVLDPLGNTIKFAKFSID
jgi:prepilin-type N-terminal cleavage/methylation domain-containing protein